MAEMVSLAFATILIVLIVLSQFSQQMATPTASVAKSAIILLLALNIVIGCTEYLVTKLLAQGIGLAGMELQPNSFALEGFSTMRTHMHVTGHKMLEGAKSIHYVRMMPMEMCHWVNPAIDIGHVKAAILVFKDVQLC
jgi:hypothetical protein